MSPWKMMTVVALPSLRQTEAILRKSTQSHQLEQMGLITVKKVQMIRSY
jgi:hypothetical protein